MSLKIVLLLLISACAEVTSHIECNSLETNDPCSCLEPVLFIKVNDTVTQGSAIAFFNSTLQPSLTSPCPAFNITNSQFTLLLDLRNPCFQTPENTCSINCQGSTKEMHLIVIQVDENPPEFQNSTYTTNILESADVEALVFNFSKKGNEPIDIDCPKDKSISYEVGEEASGRSGYFRFRAGSSGELVLKETVDYEQFDQFNLTIGVKTVVQGGIGRTGSTNIIVNILDADDHDPAFDHLEYSLNVTEETIPTTPLLGSPPVRGYDMDKGINQTILYSFSDNKNTSDFLKINTEDGTFSVVKTIDRENRSSYEMLLWCYQSDKHDKRAFATLFVHVLDINDHPAIFSPDVYDVTLVENAVGYVTTVTAKDKDIGDNAIIIYELVNITETLTVDENSGEVRVKTPADLDREESSFLTFLVLAKDKENNYSANTATVIITLQDVNDNSPEFQKEIFVFHINSTKDNDTVGQVNAVDQDKEGSPNANVSYELFQAPATLPFDIEAGTIYIKGQFDLQTDYKFMVRACDNPVEDNDRRCSLVSVVVLYGNNITFVSDEIIMEVPENVPTGTLFGSMLPVTGDKYMCSTEDFGVDMQSGMMMTKVELDRETNDTYNIIVEVFKYNEPRGNISLTISVLDVNDNAPTFTQEEYFFNIAEPLDKNTPLGTLTATDEDFAENANLTFSFQHSSSGLFSIDDVTGAIWISGQWVENTVYKQSLYHLIAVATDQGEPSFMSVVPVYISSMTINQESAVGIPTHLSKVTAMKDDNKRMIEERLEDLLGFDDIDVTGFDESTSHIFLKAYMNNTEVNVADLQRSLVQNWSPIQELFRQYMVPRSALLHSDTGLSTAEIALITISVAVFFGGLIAILIICKQWNTLVKNHKLYDSLRRPSTLYDSQELRIDFSEEEVPSRFSTFRGPGRKVSENLEGSFGLGFVNSAFNSDGDDINAPTTPTWSCNDTPRIPTWSTTDSLKDAMESLEELTNRLNSEDNISRVSHMSRGAKSQKSNKSEPVTPRSESNQPPNGSDLRISTKYEDLILTPSSDYQKQNKTPRYENLVLNPLAVKTEVKDMPENTDHEDGYDSGISEAERIQEIIETNQETADNENADAVSEGIVGDIVLEESTAF